MAETSRMQTTVWYQKTGNYCPSYTVFLQQQNFLQVIEVLYKILPDSPYYSVLSELPPPDPTSPTSTTTFEAQSAIHNSLNVINEIVALIEKDEHEAITKEVERRRMRLNSSGVEQLTKEVGLEIWASSNVSVADLVLLLCFLCITDTLIQTDPCTL